MRAGVMQTNPDSDSIGPEACDEISEARIDWHCLIGQLAHIPRQSDSKEPFVY